MYLTIETPTIKLESKHITLQEAMELMGDQLDDTGHPTKTKERALLLGEGIAVEWIINGDMVLILEASANKDECRWLGLQLGILCPQCFKDEHMCDCEI